MTGVVSSHLFLALLEARWDNGRMMDAANRVATSAHPLATSLEVLMEIGLDTERMLEVFAGIEADHVREYNRLLAQVAALPSPARPYTRAPRTKKYGPAQNPDTYFSAEKLRAYNYAADWADQAPVERLSEVEWLPLVGATYRRDNFTCTYCGADGDEYQLHCDHIIPISRGGGNVLENLTTACDFCNCSKRDALPHEWRPLRGAPQ